MHHSTFWTFTELARPQRVSLLSAGIIGSCLA